MKVNRGLESCTREIGVGLFTLPSSHQEWPNRRIVLVDTPGFDDTSLSDTDVLKMIALYLSTT